MKSLGKGFPFMMSYRATREAEMVDVLSDNKKKDKGFFFRMLISSLWLFFFFSPVSLDRVLPVNDPWHIIII